MPRYTHNVDRFCDELKALLTKHNVSLGVEIEGDTHGIETNFCVIEKDNTAHVLNQYSSYLDASDLKD